MNQENKKPLYLQQLQKSHKVKCFLTNPKFIWKLLLNFLMKLNSIICQLNYESTNESSQFSSSLIVSWREMLSRKTSYNDKPEHYQTWMSSFAELVSVQFYTSSPWFLTWSKLENDQIADPYRLTTLSLAKDTYYNNTMNMFLDKRISFGDKAYRTR